MWDSFRSSSKMLRRHRITSQTTEWCSLKLFDGAIAPLLKADQEAPDYRLSKKQPSSDTLLFEQARRWVHATDLYLYKVTERPQEGQWQVKPPRSTNRENRIRVLVAVCHRMCKRLGWDRWKSVLTIDRMLFCCIFCCSERGWWNWWWLEQKDERVSDFTSNHCLFEDSLLLIMKSHVPHDHGTILDGR